MKRTPRHPGTENVHSDGALSATEARSGLDVTALKQAVGDHLCYSIGRLPTVASPRNYYHALALAVRDRLQQRWLASTQTVFALDRKVACYLSAEFLLGPHLGNNLVNLGIEEAAWAAMAELGHDLEAILACEEEPGLGNGGLGRLAACYSRLP